MKKILLPAIFVALFLAACAMPDMSSGSVNLSINNSLSRTLVPQESLDAYSFEIRGTGSNGGSFVLDTLEQTNLIDGLTPGDWDIEIDALNEGGLIIGYGSSVITVNGGGTSQASISVGPLDGTGTLDLSMFWDTADVNDPVISSSLIPASGGSIPLTFTETSAGNADVSTTLDTGYYTLILQLLDGDTVVMGTAETVRIAADLTTTGTYDFTDVNSLDGSIDLGIDVNMDVPIDITLADVPATLTAGSTFTATASAPAETDTISYSWYLNGTLLGTGSSLTIGDSLDPGIYRLDIIAFNSDYTRSGSINQSFTVTAP